jgi:hypothetical protein
MKLLLAVLVRQMDLKVAFSIKRLYNYANHVHYVTSCVLLSILEEKSRKPVKTDIALTGTSWFLKFETYYIYASGGTYHKRIFRLNFARSHVMSSQVKLCHLISPYYCC